MPKTEQKGNGGLGNAHTNFVLNESFYTLKHLSYHRESRAGDRTSLLRSKIVDSSELRQSNF